MASDDDNGYIPVKNYTKKLKQKPAKQIKQPYTAEEYHLILSYFEQQDKKELCLLLRFLWNTGARVGETLKIKLSDLDLSNSRIFLSNKVYKGKQEALLLTPEAISIVEQVRELAILRGDANLFSWNRTYYPNESVRRAEINLGMRVKGRGLHGLRRAFSNRLFSILKEKKDISLVDIQEIMRHGSIEITLQYYKEFNQSELIKTLSKNLE